MVPWAQVITGVVGLAGIAGTIISARLTARSATRDLQLSIAAADNRAQIAEKRRVYAASLKAFRDMGIAISAVNSAIGCAGPDVLLNLRDRQTEANSAMRQAVYEIGLITGSKVSEIAQISASTLTQAAMATVEGSPPGPSSDDVDVAQGRLLLAMQKDLNTLLPGAYVDDLNI